jgi:translation initiation factor 3 subunit C
MSRFFRAGESDSDESDSDYSDELTHSESEDHSDSDSDNSSSDDDDTAKKTGGRGRLFEGSMSDSDSEDDTVRVVRSAKDKRFEEIEQAVTSMINGQKINDWVSAQNGKFSIESSQDRWIEHCRINNWIRIRIHYRTKGVNRT